MRKFLKPIAIRLLRRVAPDVLQRLNQLNDWPQLAFYQAHNQALQAEPPNANRIVFFGDSITEFWDLATAFPGQPYVNRGIAGQTTPQMLIRFRPDVIALQPKAVLILAGINDIAGNTGPMTLEMTTDNYTSFAELAQANGIQVIFASVLPVHDYGTPPRTHLLPPASIQRLNQWLQAYCSQHQHLYLDYYNAMIDDQGMLKAELAEDGVHPNARGYEVMAGLAEEAIVQAYANPGL